MSDQYPTNWPALAYAAKEGVGWRCIRCKHPDHPVDCEKEGVPRGRLTCDARCLHNPSGLQRVLTVHHLDGDKTNCRWWNLAPLCQVCHLQIQGRVSLNQTYPFHHTHWFRPYVAGYYAFVVLGEELSRNEVDDRLIELLEVGQPHLCYKAGK
jgi:hypothetical protein